MRYIVPKVTLRAIKKGKMVLKHIKIDKSKHMLKVVANSFIKRHLRVEITVEYGVAENTRGEKVPFTNSMNCKSWEDLNWALSAFLDKELWITKP